MLIQYPWSYFILENTAQQNTFVALLCHLKCIQILLWLRNLETFCYWILTMYLMYRPGQPNWEYTIWKFQDFSATQNLRKINFGYFQASNAATLTFWVALNFEFLGLFDIFKCKIPKKSKFKASKIVKMTFFDPLKWAKIDFT